jgi:hypothetical protein
MNFIREKMDSNQERVEAKIGAEIKTIQEKLDPLHEMMMARMDSHLEKMGRRPL